MKGADILYFETSNSGVLIDAYALEYSQPIPDKSQDWTLISSSSQGRILTVEALRALNTNDPQDIPLTNDSWPAIDATRIIAAWGNSSSIQYHGLTDRVAAQVRFFGSPPTDPLAALKADPSILTFAVLQSQYSIPLATTTYYHQCLPLSTVHGGTIPTASTRHVVAVEYVPDTSESSLGNVHHLVAQCYVANTGPNASNLWSADYLRNLSADPGLAYRLGIWPVPSFPAEFQGTMYNPIPRWCHGITEMTVTDFGIADMTLNASLIWPATPFNPSSRHP